MSHTPLRRARAGAVLAIATALTLSACSTGNESSSGDTGGGSGDGECRIGMSQINQTAAFFTQMNEGAEAAAKEAGCELDIANANNDSAKQSNDIDTFVTQQVTAIIVVAIDVNGVVPAVKAAKDQGITVIAIDAQLEEGTIDTFVGVDNEKAGTEAGQWVVDQGLAEGKSYGVVDAKNSFIQNQREDSFRKVVDENGAVYTTGEPATAGATAALPADGKTKVIGWDLTKEVIAGIDSGLVTAVIQQDPKTEGEEAVKEAKAILDGDDPKGFIDVPITIVTSENVDDYRDIFN
ncbi:substrate-binding domain-containing protein [Epidermidibacterium keratini]|uniref:Substrate-binding domain-containing protein n=1 Tax=Epidermidibacterium keratini TaxID=1891644 RepID=A0A7L4YNE2_9ACTN|nr:substrate-binding domain-containing protein [Epidermidibacterium keratini]QHC00413.1 substrate-binding domain-containing protein [Epidermidibacterium keratini]